VSTVKNYKTKTKRTMGGETVTIVYDLNGKFVGKAFKSNAGAGDPWKWVCEIGSDFIEDCKYGLARSYTVRTKAEALADIVGAIPVGVAR
jgi:hypothetical protein